MLPGKITTKNPAATTPTAAARLLLDELPGHSVTRDGTSVADGTGGTYQLLLISLDVHSALA